MKIVHCLPIFILTLLAFSSSAQNPTDTLLTAQAFNKALHLLSEKQIIDVRTPEEFKSGHLHGALNINFYDEDFSEQLQKLDKDKPVLVYCRSGKRSGKAAEQLQKLGFKTIFDLKGGITAWKEAELPLFVEPEIK